MIYLFHSFIPIPFIFTRTIFNSLKPRSFLLPSNLRYIFLIVWLSKRWVYCEMVLLENSRWLPSAFKKKKKLHKCLSMGHETLYSLAFTNNSCVIFQLLGFHETHTLEKPNPFLFSKHAVICIPLWLHISCLSSQVCYLFLYACKLQFKTQLKLYVLCDALPGISESLMPVLNIKLSM